MLEPWQFALVFLGILLLGGILYALTGFISVKKGRVAIIERVGQFVGLYKPGLYYFAPMLYRRVGMYRVGVIKDQYLINRIDYQLTYEIIDVKIYHYVGKHDIEGILRATLKDSRNDLSNVMNKRCEAIGVKFIQLEIIKNA
ncbi:MAG: hypothetical protein MJ221_02810 [Bacilli bacterium]|nr:hypothetical protein [Bacilli bacterium]